MNLVVIQGSKYSFYVNRKNIVSVEVKDGYLTKEQLEEYRDNPMSIFSDITQDED